MKERDVSENSGRLSVYLRVARPDHWFKNVLVLGGGTVVVWRPDIDVGPYLSVAWRLGCALLVTCLASGANYIVNEILDGPRDKLHTGQEVSSRSCQRGVLWPVMGSCRPLCADQRRDSLVVAAPPILPLGSRLPSDRRRGVQRSSCSCKGNPLRRRNGRVGQWAHPTCHWLVCPNHGVPTAPRLPAIVLDPRGVRHGGQAVRRVPVHR